MEHSNRSLLLHFCCRQLLVLGGKSACLDCANPVQALHEMHGGCHMVHYSMALVVVCNYAPQLPTLSPLPHTPALQGWASPCSLELNKFNLKDCEVWAAM